MRNLTNSSLSGQFPHRSAGFTLLELMITVVVLGTLAVIAYASYTDQILKAQRSVAKSALLDAATRQERYFFSNRTYTTTITNLGYAGAYFGKDGAPSASSTDAIYELSAVINDTTACDSATCFKLTATPVTGSLQAGDKCGNFTITSTNKRDVINSNGASASDCW